MRSCQSHDGRALSWYNLLSKQHQNYALFELNLCLTEQNESRKAHKSQIKQENDEKLKFFFERRKLKKIQF